MQNTISSFQELQKLPNNAPYYFYGAKTYTTGWKMHLFLNSGPDKFPDLHNKTVEKLAKFLIEQNLEHKFQNGCDGANTFCIYIGERTDCERLAQTLITKFGPDFRQLSPQGNQFRGSDQNLFDNPNIGIRFDGVNENPINSPFLRYGDKGIPGFLHRISITNSVLGRDVSEQDEEKLKRLACHIILAKYCGQKYLGQDYTRHPWDQELFSECSMFSAAEIQKYTKACIAMFSPSEYIEPTSLATQGYEIDVAAKMQNCAPSKPNSNISQIVEKIRQQWIK